MTTIKEKIEAGEYSSAAKAAGSIKMSKLPKGEKTRLMELIPKYYPDGKLDSVATMTKADRLDPTVDFAGTPPSKQLSHEVTALALKVMSLAVKHQLSREQVFDLLKERTTVEG